MSWIKHYRDLPAELAIKVDEAATAARAAFEAFAMNDIGDPAPEHPVDKMQVDLWRWQQKNFGIQPDNNIALGVVEELGETMLSLDQHDLDGVTDGVGDIQVYVGQLATRNRLALREIQKLRLVYVDRWFGEPDVELIREQLLEPILGHLGHVVLKHIQKIRDLGEVNLYRVALVEVCARLLASVDVLLQVDEGEIGEQWISGSMVDAYLATGATVLERDWQRNQATGAV